MECRVAWGYPTLPFIAPNTDFFDKWYKYIMRLGESHNVQDQLSNKEYHIRYRLSFYRPERQRHVNDNHIKRNGLYARIVN